MNNQPPFRVTVVVLGDLGRSPRMSAHAAALARHGAEVTLAGYAESALDEELQALPNVRIRPIPQHRRASDTASRVTFLLTSALRAARQHIHLLRVLLDGPRPDAILVQNPPAVPTLMITWLAARIRRSRLLIDWHNFGWAMIALRLGSRNPVIRVARAYERFWGRRADAHFCVSEAMRNALQPYVAARSCVVLYDQPRQWFPPLPSEQKQQTLCSILSEMDVARDGRVVAVCPTSWTADEDTDLLSEALRRFDAAPSPRRLLVILTGKGPRREEFERRVRESEWKSVEIRTAFLPIEQYRCLLRAAHFGISLHRSASGLDLPMKIVDMFGARTPVCALHYGPVIEEQLAGTASVTFRNVDELVDRLNVLVNLQGGADPLCSSQHLAAARQDQSWYDAWDAIAWPLFKA